MDRSREGRDTELYNYDYVCTYSVQLAKEVCRYAVYMDVCMLRPRVESSVQSH